MSNRPTFMESFSLPNRVASAAILLTALVCAGGSHARSIAAQIVRVSGEAEVIREDGSTLPALVDQQISVSDRLYTGLDSEVELTLPDKSQVVVRELTDLVLRSLVDQRASLETRLWLKAGEVSVEVGLSDTVKSDFEIRTPTATCSVRGSGGTIRQIGDQFDHQTRHGHFETLDRSTGARSATGAHQEVRTERGQGLNRPDDLKLSHARVNSLPPGATLREHRAANALPGQQNGSDTPGGPGNPAGNHLLETARLGGPVSLQNGVGGTGLIANGDFTNGLDRWHGVNAAGLTLPLGGVSQASAFSVDGGKVAFVWSGSSPMRMDAGGGGLEQRINVPFGGPFQVLMQYNFLTEEFTAPAMMPVAENDRFVLSVTQGGGFGSGHTVYHEAVASVAGSHFSPDNISVPGNPTLNAFTSGIARATGPQSYTSQRIFLQPGTDFYVTLAIVDGGGGTESSGALVDRVGLFPVNPLTGQIIQTIQQARLACEHHPGMAFCSDVGSVTAP